MRLLVFDSGVGGVGIVQQLRQEMPQAGSTYLMDNAGFPYGARTDADGRARGLGVGAAGLARVRPDVVVIACNTASTLALAALRARHPVPFVGCVPPVKAAAALSRTRTIGVLGTPATVRGPYLRALAEQHAPDCRVLIQGAANLAALAEARFAGQPVAAQAVCAEVAPLLAHTGGAELDAVALGCTHYAWLLPELRDCLPARVAWLDPAGPVARQTSRVAAGCGADSQASDADGLVLATRKTGLLGQGWAAAALTMLSVMRPAADREAYSQSTQKVRLGAPPAPLE